MDRQTREYILSTNADVILLDIDGTIKDLVREHQEVLETIVNGFNRGKNLRRKFVFWLDKIAMSFVKSGMLSTNRAKQNFLLNLYALILGKNMKDFRNLYNIFYKQKVIVFDGAKELLEQVPKTKRLYFVTINDQNYNLEELGIKKEDIICVKTKRKLKAYAEIISCNNINPNKVLIVGDNISDDIKPAKKLGCKYLLVDNYNSKIKRMLAKSLNVGM